QWYRRRTLRVNSYHHQGIRRLASRFKPMAFAKDELIEGYYDPKADFLVGLQFHPERMLKEYAGNWRVWQAFGSAVHRALLGYPLMLRVQRTLRRWIRCRISCACRTGCPGERLLATPVTDPVANLKIRAPNKLICVLNQGKKHMFAACLKCAFLGTELNQAPR